MKYLCVILALLIGVQPLIASAQRGGGRGGGGRGGGARAGGSARAGGARAGGGGGRSYSGGGGRSYSGGGGRSSGGFNFSGDTMRSPSSYGNRGNVGGNNLGSNNLGNNRNGVGSNNRNGIGNNDRGNNSIGGNNRRDSNVGSNNNRRNTNVNTGNRTVINNPTYAAGGAYGWNGGVAWAPAPYYYGGGFWGAMAIGVTSAAVYGAIVDEDEETHQETTYNSYQVQPNTPGASFLTSYGLTQVKCGPPNLVVVYGPENSVVCANPNGNVAAGNYDLNTENLSLTQR